MSSPGRERLGDAVELGLREAAVQRERERPLEGPVGSGERALAGVRAEPVQRVGADLRLDPRLAQARERLVAAVELDYVRLQAVTVAVVGAREDDVEGTQAFRVAARDALSSLQQLVELAQLRDSDRAEDVAEAVVEAALRHVVVRVRRRPAVVAELARTF